jgi:hypothetical protein
MSWSSLLSRRQGTPTSFVNQRDILYINKHKTPNGPRQTTTINQRRRTWSMERGAQTHNNARSTFRKGSPLSSPTLNSTLCRRIKSLTIVSRASSSFAPTSSLRPSTVGNLSSQDQTTGNTLIPPTEPIKTKPIYLLSNPTLPLRLTSFRFYGESNSASHGPISGDVFTQFDMPHLRNLMWRLSQELSPFTEATIRKHFARSAQRLNPHCTFSSSVLKHYS